eukprot:EG_transcript_53795
MEREKDPLSSLIEQIQGIESERRAECQKLKAEESFHKMTKDELHSVQRSIEGLELEEENLKRHLQSLLNDIPAIDKQKAHIEFQLKAAQLHTLALKEHVDRQHAASE